MDDKKHISNDDFIQGFWKGQFSEFVTPLQIAFDALVGIILPLACFSIEYMMGGVFTARSIMGKYAMFVYTAFGLQFLFLVFSLFLKTKIKLFNAILSGGLFWGAILAFVIGLMLLPLSVPGLLLIIGILGFVPFVTSFTLLRNAIRALTTAKKTASTISIAVFVFIGLTTISIPLYVNWRLNQALSRSIETIIDGDQPAVTTATEHLTKWRWFADCDKLVWAYQKEEDEAQKQTLSKAYQAITGEEIEYRVD